VEKLNYWADNVPLRIRVEKDAGEAPKLLQGQALHKRDGTIKEKIGFADGKSVLCVFSVS